MLDVVIKNGTLVDGTGAPGFTGDIAVKDGRIVKVGGIIEEPAAETVNASGKIVAPGFIDVHRHGDIKVLEEGFGEIELRQGITTVLSGNCGLSLAPCPDKYREELYEFFEPMLGKSMNRPAFETFGAYVNELKAKKLACNYGCFVGNGTVRIAAKGFGRSSVTRQELDKAKYYIEDAMEAGAMGLSLGLAYSPENYYQPEELAALCSLVQKYGRLLAVHLRGEGNSLVSSVEEVIRLAEEAQVSLHISHFKAAGRNNWGVKLEAAMERILEARQRGMEVTCDVYPYEAGSSTLLNILPPAFLEGGMEELVKRLRDPEKRRQLEEEMGTEQTEWDNLVYSLGWGAVVVSSVVLARHRPYVGKSIADIAAIEGKSPIDCLAGLIVEEKGKVGQIFFHMCQEDVERVMKWEHSMIMSDSLYPADGLPHPRIYGAFPRVLARYVREKRLLTLEEAIHKMTCFPATRFGLEKRGQLAQGYAADLVVFDLAKVGDRSTYTQPVQYAEGFHQVYVAGKKVVQDDVCLQTKSGGFIAGKGKK